MKFLTLDATFSSLSSNRSLAPHFLLEHFASALQTSFSENESSENSDHYNVNVAVIGACDGTHDRLISNFFLPFANWEGLFVEPVSFNFISLTELIANHSAVNRSVVLRAAVFDPCETPSIQIKRPLFEEKNMSEPHWKRRQIGHIVFDRTTAKELIDDRDDSEKKNGDYNIGVGKEVASWKHETVRCVTPLQLFFEWRSNILRRYSALKPATANS